MRRHILSGLGVLAAALLPSLAWPDWRATSFGWTAGALAVLAAFLLLGRFSTISQAGFAGRFGATLAIHGVLFAVLVVLSVHQGLHLVAATAPFVIAASGGLLGVALSFHPVHVR